MRSREQFGYPKKRGLYDPAFEKDSCGVGLVAHIKGERSHQILTDAYQALLNMDHRGARGCEPNTGDGAGILTGLPHEFLSRVAREELGIGLPPPGRLGTGLVFLPPGKTNASCANGLSNRSSRNRDSSCSDGEGCQLTGIRRTWGPVLAAPSHTSSSFC